MIYLFTGDDTKKKQLSYEKFLKSVPKNIDRFFIQRNNFNGAQLESFYSGAGLFFTKALIIFSDILDREETREVVLKNIDKMSKSENMFLFSERKLNKPVLDVFKKQKAEIYLFELPKEKKEKFNNFLLANAFEARDKLSLWIYYRQAVDKGVGLEELVGVLFWKAKDMILKNRFGKLKESEVKKVVEKLPYLLPAARSKGKDAEIVFEQFLLEVF